MKGGEEARSFSRVFDAKTARNERQLFSILNAWFQFLPTRPDRIHVMHNF
jgi:hypothetical protein